MKKFKKISILMFSIITFTVVFGAAILGPNISKNNDNKVKTQNVYYASGTVSSMLNFNTSADIYIIRNEIELKEFSAKVNAGITFANKIIYLTNDITLSGASNNHIPIGTSSYPFKGTFDGNGYVISNIQISKTTTNNVGLFGYVSGGTIRNVKISNGNISGKGNTGGIVGYIESGTIEQCFNNVVNITVGANGNGGGIVGYANASKIYFCRNNVKINTTKRWFNRRYSWKRIKFK